VLAYRLPESSIASCNDIVFTKKRRRPAVAQEVLLARLESRLKLGYFPLNAVEAHRILAWLRFPADASAIALDPCAGTGKALTLITDGANVIRHGIELDSFRAEKAQATLDHVVQGDCFDVHCAVESYGLLLLNPPYDFECSEGHNERTERLFLEQCFRWLQPGGVLVLVIPAQRVGACSQVLAAHFREISIRRLTEPDSSRYQQVVVFGIRRTGQERDRVKDIEVGRERGRLWQIANKYQDLPPLDNASDGSRVYTVPPGKSAQLVYRGLPLDLVEDILPRSAAYRQAGRILFAPRTAVTGKPLTPLHAGHVAILAVSGSLDGLFGAGEDRHLACWSSDKTTDKFEETDDQGVTTIRERERFTQTLTLLYADGRAAILREGNSHEERSPANGAPRIPKDDQGNGDSDPGAHGPVDC
jgi:SAM-dependent methyltransferase